LPINLIVLQHPAEKKKKMVSSVPLIELVLQRITVINGFSFGPETNDLLKKVLTPENNHPRPLLLFPLDEEGTLSLDGEASITDLTILQGNLQKYHHRQSPFFSSKKGEGEKERELMGYSQKLTEGEFYNDDYPTLILIDGTWQQARQIQLRSPELVKSCQVVQFEEPIKSIINDVRREPKGHYSSTLEALCRTLTILDSLLGGKENGRVGVQGSKESVLGEDLTSSLSGGGGDCCDDTNNTTIQEACYWLLKSLQAMVDVQVTCAENATPRYHERKQKRKQRGGRRVVNTESDDDHNEN